MKQYNSTDRFRALIRPESDRYFLLRQKLLSLLHYLLFHQMLSDTTDRSIRRRSQPLR